MKNYKTFLIVKIRVKKINFFNRDYFKAKNMHKKYLAFYNKAFKSLSYLVKKYIKLFLSNVRLKKKSFFYKLRSLKKFLSTLFLSLNELSV